MTIDGEVLLPHIPGFRLRRKVGRGGSATVYLAEQEGAGFSREVAVKVVDRELTPAALRRVQEEQRILARLEHPGIARLYDAGVTSLGRPYLAMEYVQGETLVEHCRSRRLPLRERLELFLEVLAAVAYAHGEAVVHRDLKPAHILISERGEAKLLDFGIAKLMADPTEEGGGEGETVTLHRAMTPAYASPEQVRGERITAASDVYSLGVVLYELLAETLPYRLDGRTFETYPDAIRGQDPEPPSAAFARTAGTTTAGTTARERVEVLRRSRALRGDLDAVLLKALRKEPQTRYESVAALADDLRRFLAGRPVLAQRGSFRYRAARFLRRHRTAPAAAIAIAALLLAFALRPSLPAPHWGGPGGSELDVGLDRVAALVRRGRTEEASVALARLRQATSPRSGAESDPRLDLAEAEVAHRLGEYQRAAALADTALGRAQALRSLPLALRAERLHGDAIARLDQRREARQQLESVAARADAAGLPAEAAPARLALGILLLRTAGNDEARAVLERARAGFQATGDRRGQVAVRSQLAMLAGKRGELEEGIRSLREALATARSIGDRFGEGTVLANLIILLNWADEEAEVDSLLAPTLAALRDSGNRPVLISALANSTINAVERVDLERAEGYIQEAEGLAGQVGSVMASASVDRARAYLEHTRGNDDLARQRYNSAVEKARRTGVWMAAGSYLADLASVELATDHPEAAGQRAREAIEAFLRGGDPRQAKNTELVLAWVDARQGRAAAARQRLAEVRRELEKRGDAAGGAAGEFGLLSLEAKVGEALGEWRKAVALRRRAVKMAEEWNAKGLLLDQRVGLARALAGAGERKELEELAGELLPELDRLGLHGPARQVRELLATAPRGR